MGYIFRLNDIERYEDELRSEQGRAVFALETGLLKKVWSPVSPQRVLQVGCGSGIFLDWFASLGHCVTGLDPSGPSLELARKNLSARVDLDRGFAEDLPYSDNEFDTVALITSLEFVRDPGKALSEAARVARRNILLGVLNRYSIGRVQYFLERFWKDSLYSNARFFSVFQLRKMAFRTLAGQVPIEWRTCFFLPLPLLRYFHLLERCPVLQRFPFGHFIAMRIDLQNRLLTLQTPVFSEIPSGAANAASARPLCRLSLCGDLHAGSRAPEQTED